MSMNITEPQPITTELRLERRVLESYYAPDMADRTVDGVVELMAGLQESMQAVRADWRATVAGDRQTLEQLAAPHIERINKSRRRTNLEESDVKVSEVSENFCWVWRNRIGKNICRATRVRKKRSAGRALRTNILR